MRVEKVESKQADAPALFLRRVWVTARPGRSAVCHVLFFPALVVRVIFPQLRVKDVYLGNLFVSSRSALQQMAKWSWDWKDQNDIQMFPITQRQPPVCLCYYSNVVIQQVQKHTDTADCLQAVNFNGIEIISFMCCGKCFCRCGDYTAT